MTDFDNLCLALALLWFGAVICFAMKWFRYFVSADLGMLIILCNFTILAVRHNVVLPTPSFTATAQAAAPTVFVTRQGDGFYHWPDCERLLGTRVTHYSGSSKSPCVDCVLPRRSQSAGGANDGPALAARHSAAR